MLSALHLVLRHSGLSNPKSDVVAWAQRLN
jgi:hypothetical protein